jgi:hypothetical protein
LLDNPVLACWLFFPMIPWSVLTDWRGRKEKDPGVEWIATEVTSGYEE